MACYELAKNKDIQQKARDDVLKQFDDGIKYESINSMTYLDMVMNEVLRLYPPVGRVERVVTEPINLNGVDLDIGTTVVIPTVGIHHDPEYYPDPFSFKPERFNQEEKQKRNPYVFLAFGAGPRNCIALRFAGMNSKVCMSYILKEYEIDICDKTPIPFEHDPRGFFLKSKHDIILKFRKINN